MSVSTLLSTVPFTPAGHVCRWLMQRSHWTKSLLDFRAVQTALDKVNYFEQPQPVKWQITDVSDFFFFFCPSPLVGSSYRSLARWRLPDLTFKSAFSLTASLAAWRHHKALGLTPVRGGRGGGGRKHSKLIIIMKHIYRAPFFNNSQAQSLINFFCNWNLRRLHGVGAKLGLK